MFTAAIELAQLSPGRHARISDFLVNLLGLGVGIALAYLVATPVKGSCHRLMTRPLTKIIVVCKRAFLA